MKAVDVDTPSLLVDLSTMERNLARAAQYTQEKEFRFRPHTKTHKSPALAKRQLDLGATGLTVAKVGEAEVMCKSNPPDLLVAYPVLGPQKLQRLMKIAADVPVSVALDSAPAALQLSEAASKAGVEVSVLTEMDAGFGRVGVKPSEILSLAKYVSQLPFLHFAGVSFFPGHILPRNGGLAQFEAIHLTLTKVLEDLDRAGIPASVVSGGSTPTLLHSHLLPSMNEIRSGTYIFNDKNTVVAGGCTYEDCAAVLTVTIISIARDGQVIVDAGSKAISSDPLVGSQQPSFGHVLEAPEAVFYRMNEEHGYIDVRKTGRRFAIGDRLHIIPNHICVVVNLQEEIYGFRGEEIEEIWSIEARGKLK